ncbi:hypothetical protein SS50377_21984 [Spironucleus salmonicida]|uniref:Uncharacterized protein n=1 Tax=Spironucleus salmonicida TaxID=348837 RepID=V6LQR9_9EUKA|nr:hypothetical protein SS50377_21984 [Spironucleus salmonicida]|eukprot:EST47022.1 Hypothetical protein SS50377_12978 [Spironucleus salmonicida]
MGCGYDQNVILQESASENNSDLLNFVATMELQHYVQTADLYDQLNDPTKYQKMTLLLSSAILNTNINYQQGSSDICDVDSLLKAQNSNSGISGDQKEHEFPLVYILDQTLQFSEQHTNNNKIRQLYENIYIDAIENDEFEDPIKDCISKDPNIILSIFK